MSTVQYRQIEITEDLSLFKSVIESDLNNHLLKRPIILTGFDIGQCVLKWSETEYLKSALVRDTKSKRVAVHVSHDRSLSFSKRNFAKQSMTIADFIEKLGQSDKAYYFRSLSLKDPVGTPANLSRDFPSLASDLEIPASIYDKSAEFSSVLRITSPDLQLWMHYDMMDNILIQIRGQKVCWLFDPDQLRYLHMSGNKSAIDDDPKNDWDKVDLDKYPEFRQARGYRCVLEPGQILFFPALWLHNMRTTSTNNDWSVSVNVFWRELNSNKAVYDQTDACGNRDLPVAQEALNSVQKSFGELKKLPKKYELFYLRRMQADIARRIDRVTETVEKTA